VEHFYTTSAEERDGAVSRYGYTYEGIACYVMLADEEDTTALRDQIATAICGHIVEARLRATGEVLSAATIAASAYKYADAMIAARVR
jgi:hypothetical protein